MTMTHESTNTITGRKSAKTPSQFNAFGPALENYLNDCTPAGRQSFNKALAQRKSHSTKRRCAGPPGLRHSRPSPRASESRQWNNAKGAHSSCDRVSRHSGPRYAGSVYARSPIFI